MCCGVWWSLVCFFESALILGMMSVEGRVSLALKMN